MRGITSSNQIGKTISKIVKRQIRKAEIFGEFSLLSINLYKGKKRNAKIKPVIIDSNIGLTIRNDKTASSANIITIATFFAEISVILTEC